MKPKPFASLNHLTVPDVLIGESPSRAAFGDSNTSASSRSGKPLMARATVLSAGELPRRLASGRAPQRNCSTPLQWRDPLESPKPYWQDPPMLYMARR